jgi:hypothetical protein
VYPHETLFSGRICLNIPAIPSGYHPDHWPEPHPTTLTGGIDRTDNRAFTSR